MHLRAALLSMATVVPVAAARAEEPAADGFTLRSARDGDWSEPATWEPARAPEAGDRIWVRPGTSVRYDVRSDAVFPVILVGGRLSFARDRDTLLAVGILRVQGGDPSTVEGGAGVEDVHDENHHGHPPGVGAEVDGAALEVGTPDRPIPAPHVARIRLHYIEGMNRENAPAIVCRPGGRMEFHGAPMSRTWLKLRSSVASGDRRVRLAADVEGWYPGDEVIVTGSLHHNSLGGQYRRRPELLHTEIRRIEAIKGSTVTLDRALEHPHFGEGELRSEVANLSRRVVVESADPGGVRGHTMYHRYAAGGISYARFAHLGKAGVLGRYPIHFHRLRDSLRGTSVIGAAVVDSHNRWITIHGTQYMVVRDCVGFRSLGHGFFLEDGTEIYNVLDRNLAVQAFKARRLPGQVLPFDPNDGAGFWWANGRNTLVRNVACENDQYGFRYDSQNRSNFDSHLAVRMPDGSPEVVDIREIPFYRFEDNEAHTEGLYGMAFAGTEGAGPDHQHPHVLKRLRIWQVHYALRAQLPTMWIEDVLIDHAAYGVYRPRFDHHVYRDIVISETNTEPFNRGLDDRSLQHGPITVDGITFRGVRQNDRVPLIQLSALDPSGHAESHFRNVRIVDRKDGNRRALVNLGGGPRLRDVSTGGVPVYLHDYYGPGEHAKVVSARARPHDGARYVQDPPLTGDESLAARVRDVPFPDLLRPVDDQPPVTVITWPVRGIDAPLEGGRLVVRGTSTDNGAVRRVVVNGVPARSVEHAFHLWEATLADVEPGTLVLEAHAEDAAGNRERTGHNLRIRVTRGARRARL